MIATCLHSRKRHGFDSRPIYDVGAPQSTLQSPLGWNSNTFTSQPGLEPCPPTIIMISLINLKEAPWAIIDQRDANADRKIQTEGKGGPRPISNPVEYSNNSTSPPGSARPSTLSHDPPQLGGLVFKTTFWRHLMLMQVQFLANLCCCGISKHNAAMGYRSRCGVPTGVGILAVIELRGSAFASLKQSKKKPKWEAISEDDVLQQRGITFKIVHSSSKVFHTPIGCKGTQHPTFGKNEGAFFYRQYNTEACDVRSERVRYVKCAARAVCLGVFGIWCLGRIPESRATSPPLDR